MLDSQNIIWGFPISVLRNNMFMQQVHVTKVSAGISLKVLQGPQK